MLVKTMCNLIIFTVEYWLPEDITVAGGLGATAAPRHRTDDPNSLHKCEISGSHSRVDEDSRSVVYNAVHMDKQIPAFRRSLLPLIFRIVQEYQTNLHGVILRTGNII
jgi:hypothetical protein